jgi:hypothetical protein
MDVQAEAGCGVVKLAQATVVHLAQMDLHLVDISMIAHVHQPVLVLMVQLVHVKTTGLEHVIHIHLLL